MRIISWNVNGVRAAQKKGFLDWLKEDTADIVCIQETKAHPEQLDIFLLHPDGYETFWNSAERKGYSGVATFCKKKPISVKKGFGLKKYDGEGRVIETEFVDFTLLNIYFPNGGQGPERLKFKMEFYDQTLKYVTELKKAGKSVIISGDYNTAHKPIDLARPKENEKNTGFLPEERAWLDKWIEAGQVDIYRQLYPEKVEYSWWDMKSRARDRNVGWRIDYHFVSNDLVSRVKDAKILMDIMGSDHCPIEIELKG